MSVECIEVALDRSISVEDLHEIIPAAGVDRPGSRDPPSDDHQRRSS